MNLFEKIRLMSVDELAEYLALQKCEYCDDWGECYDKTKCINYEKEYLLKEVEQ